MPANKFTATVLTVGLLASVQLASVQPASGHLIGSCSELFRGPFRRVPIPASTLSLGDVVVVTTRGPGHHHTYTRVVTLAAAEPRRLITIDGTAMQTSHILSINVLSQSRPGPNALSLGDVIAVSDSSGRFMVNTVRSLENNVMTLIDGKKLTLDPSQASERIPHVLAMRLVRSSLPVNVNDLQVGDEVILTDELGFAREGRVKSVEEGVLTFMNGRRVTFGDRAPLPDVLSLSDIRLIRSSAPIPPDAIKNLQLGDQVSYLDSSGDAQVKFIKNVAGETITFTSGATLSLAASPPGENGAPVARKLRLIRSSEPVEAADLRSGDEVAYRDLSGYSEVNRVKEVIDGTLHFMDAPPRSLSEIVELRLLQISHPVDFTRWGMREPGAEEPPRGSEGHENETLDETSAETLNQTKR